MQRFFPEMTWEIPPCWVTRKVIVLLINLDSTYALYLLSHYNFFLSYFIMSTYIKPKLLLSMSLICRGPTYLYIFSSSEVYVTNIFPMLPLLHNSLTNRWYLFQLKFSLCFMGVFNNSPLTIPFIIVIRCSCSSADVKDT